MITWFQLQLKEAGNSFQHFSNSYTLNDEFYNCLPSDATIMVSYKFPVIDKQVAVILFIWQVTIATIWSAKNALNFSFKRL